MNAGDASVALFLQEGRQPEGQGRYQRGRVTVLSWLAGVTLSCYIWLLSLAASKLAGSGHPHITPPRPTHPHPTPNTTTRAHLQYWPSSCIWLLFASNTAATIKPSSCPSLLPPPPAGWTEGATSMPQGAPGCAAAARVAAVAKGCTSCRQKRFPAGSLVWRRWQRGPLPVQRQMRGRKGEKGCV